MFLNTNFSSFVSSCQLPLLDSFPAHLGPGLTAVDACQTHTRSATPSCASPSQPSVFSMGQLSLDQLVLPSPSESLWHPHYASSSPMDQYSSFASSWLGSTIICAALAWILYRATQVLLKPTDELISLLGLDVPVAPTLSLAGLKADGFILHWKALDQRSVGVKHNLLVNGVNVGELSLQDPSIEICGLLPDRGYVIRVAAVNGLNFSDNSEPLQIHTKPASSRDFFREIGQDGNDDPVSGISIRPYKALLDTLSGSQAPTPMQREHSGSLSQKRNAPRRQTQSAPSIIDLHSHPIPTLPESEDSIRELTEKLDRIRADTDQHESQMRSEEEKYQAEYETLTTSLQDIQQQLQDKSNATRKLNQQVAALVTEESTARKTKAAIDRQLEKVTHERQKMKDDMGRWEKEAIEADERIAQLSKEQEKYQEHAQKKIVDFKEKLAAESAKNKTMEDHIRQTVAQIKELEEEKKKVDGEYDDTTTGAMPNADEEESFKQRMLELQSRYSLLFHQQQQLRTALINDSQLLESWKQYYAAQKQAYQVPHIDIAPPRRNSGRRRAPSLNSQRRPSYQNYEPATSATYGQTGFSGISPSFHTISPFINITNGMTLPADNMTMSPVDSEQMLSNAPTSPSAVTTLLPSDLLGDDESRFGDSEARSRSLSLKDSHSDPNILPGLGALGTLEHTMQDPSSPVSLASRSPSTFASPRESTTHLPHMSGSGSFMDTDRRSVRSNTNSARAVSGGVAGTKFANLFHLGRQRNKTTSDEGPSLGSLKAAESQSLPRGDIVDLGDPNGSPTKRRGSHAGQSWMGQMLGRANTSASVEDNRKKRFNMFGMGAAPRNDPWGDRDSPRPASTSSENHALPRPSAGSRFGWPVSGADSFGSQRNSHLDTDWSLANLSSNSTSWATRLHSRNSSAQYPHLLDDTLETPETLALPPQAPIGTRPKSSSHAPSKSSSLNQSASAAATNLKLNPNAPAFKTFFGRVSTEKNPASQKGHSTANSIDGADPRASRDTLSTADYDYDASVDARESLDRSVSSAAPSDATPRESFMQKLSRKSSAGFSTIAGLRGSAKKAREASAQEVSEATAETDEESATPGRTPLVTVLPDDKSGGLVSPGMGRGFSLRSLRRRKGDKATADPMEADGEDGEDGLEEQVVGRGKEKKTA
ncbi:hypothetical protein BT63DRAFT_460320 [Microthyrium microscopicum]|uniref:Fibronectin type-III domain-containing protein n=1 Tax=Microthyrium microscopicum TaxID=703497 RepID=A0A6A6TXG9_9PEZI|nr:hypothetical protein BT63DRAFT_460320 [Microthyrium microscopicum]